ncbi:MAG: hypothetical protein AAGD01_06795 [Acidobacteriota bacterium]
MFDPGTLVITHLGQPTEQLWGILLELAPHGVTLQALSVNSFEDFIAQAARGGEQSLGLATLFIPMYRVRKIYLDEQVGPVESYQQRFESRVGMSVQAYLGLEDLAQLEEDPGSLPS